MSYKITEDMAAAFEEHDWQTAAGRSDMKPDNKPSRAQVMDTLDTLLKRDGYPGESAVFEYLLGNLTEGADMAEVQDEVFEILERVFKFHGYLLGWTSIEDLIK